MAWYVYMLRCGDGSLYTGSTTDVARRLREHQNGTGAKYTRTRPPVTLAYRGGSGPLRRPAPGGGYQKAAPETEIGADRRRYTMNLKKRLALGVFISTLLAFSAYYAEYLPFTGKWIAAYRMDRYAQEQYPGFHCGKVYFNPCGAPYEAVLTGDSGQEVELGCGYDGLIGDPLRAERWMQNNHISKVMWALNRLEQGSYGNVSCQWRYDMPERPVFVLKVQIREPETVPFPESETALREKMVAALASDWAALPESAQADITDVEAVYRHYATKREEQQPYDNSFYIVHVSVTNGVLPIERIMTAAMKEEKT